MPKKKNPKKKRGVPNQANRIRHELKAAPDLFQRAARELLCERSFPDFFRLFWPILEPSAPLIMSPALDAILEHLEAFARGEIKRLLINVPPGFSKSMATSVFMPAWIWGPRGRPDARFITTSYDANLAIRDNLRCRNLLLSEEFKSIWGERVAFRHDERGKMRYANTSGGWRQATSVNAALTGHRADFIIIDDPHSTKGAESDAIRKTTLRWFSETLPTRLNSQMDSGIVCIMQRLHTNDIAGHILKNDLGYEVLCIPMEYEPDHPTTSTRWKDWRTEPGELADPIRFPRQAVDDLKRLFMSEGGSYAIAGQLQQRPIPRGGGMFKEDWFRFLDFEPDPDAIVVGPVRGWDLAASDNEGAAYTVGVKGCRLRDGRVVILDVVRAQLEAAEVYSMIRDTAERDGELCQQSLPQDPGQAGKDQRRHLAALLAGYNCHFSPESGSKALRAQSLASQAEAGNVALVLGDWNTAFVKEACDFPRGQYLDQVDAASRMFSRLLVLPDSMADVPVAPRVLG